MEAGVAGVELQVSRSTITAPLPCGQRKVRLFMPAAALLVNRYKQKRESHESSASLQGRQIDLQARCNHLCGNFSTTADLEILLRYGPSGSSKTKLLHSPALI